MNDFARGCGLFERISEPDDLDKISAEELNKIIYQVGFHNNKPSS